MVDQYDKIYGTSTIVWQNSTLDLRKFYDIKFLDFARSQSGCNKIEILWIKLKYDLMLSHPKRTHNVIYFAF